MDTSETYIKMRFEAIPDMGLGKPAVIAEIPSKTFVDTEGDWYFVYQESKKLATICQLERQDQLQEMLTEYDWRTNFSRFKIFSEEFSFETNNYPESYKQETPLAYFDSMEQLWLAFVMKENRSKVWTGEKWEKV